MLLISSQHCESCIVNAVFQSFYKRLWVTAGGAERVQWKLLGEFCFPPLIAALALVTVGCVPLHGCFLTIKGLTWQDIVAASSAGRGMGLFDWVEKREGKEGVGCEWGFALLSPSLSVFPSPPWRTQRALLARQARCSVVVSCWISFHLMSSPLTPFPGFTFSCN